MGIFSRTISSKSSKCLLQLVLWTNILHQASALECYTCLYIQGVAESCNCNQSPQKNCPRLVEGRSSTGSAKAVPQHKFVQDFLSRRNTTNGRSDDLVCSLTESFVDGKRVIVRLIGPENGQAQVEMKLPTTPTCKVENSDVWFTDEKGNQANFKKGCFCNTDYCNGEILPDSGSLSIHYPGSLKEIRWSSISWTLLLLVMSICLVQKQ